MSAKRQKTSEASQSRRGRLVKDVRKALGRTQQQLGLLLGSSAKAVQSYEQGWRNVPVRALNQLLVLLALHRRRDLKEIPCWEVKQCPAGTRDQCPSWTVGDGQFCWLIASKMCRDAHAASSREAMPCIGCPVVRRLLAG